MLRLTEPAAGLVLAYPLWVGVLCFAAGAALIAYAARPKAAVKKRWAVLAVSGILMWAGVYFGTFRVTLTPESGRVYAFLMQDDRMDWSEARTAAVVTRIRGKGGPKEFMVAIDESLRELEIPLGGLSDPERQRVVGYVYSRMPR
jgi:hypothetical protein